jgi:hypothetical protein
VAGSVTLNSGGTRYDIRLRVPHGSYDETTVKNDIALLKSKEKIKFNNVVRKVNLPLNLPRDGTVLTATGWGYTSVSSLP